MGSNPYLSLSVLVFTVTSGKLYRAVERTRKLDVDRGDITDSLCGDRVGGCELTARDSREDRDLSRRIHAVNVSRGISLRITKTLCLCEHA